MEIRMSKKREWRKENRGKIEKEKKDWFALKGGH